MIRLNERIKAARRFFPDGMKTDAERSGVCDWFDVKNSRSERLGFKKNLQYHEIHTKKEQRHTDRCSSVCNDTMCQKRVLSLLLRRQVREEPIEGRLKQRIEARVRFWL